MSSLALCLTMAAPAVADSGRAGLAFLRLNIGPREVAMGGVGAAVGGDVYSMTYNPALLSGLRAQELGFSDAEWFEGIRYQDLLYAYPAEFGHLGVRLQNLTYGQIQGYDATGAKMGTPSAGDMLAGFHFARALPDSGVALGAGLKLARETLDTMHAQAFLADLGASYRPRYADWRGDLTFGVALRNLGSSVKFDQESAPVPTEAVFGASGKLLQESMILGADIHWPRDSGPSGNIGLEFQVLDALWLRAGLREPSDQGPGISAGFGFKFSRVAIDYAFVPMGDLGYTNHIGLRWTFGGPAEAAYRAGMRQMRDGKYSEAILKFNETLSIDPKYPKAGQRLREAYEQLKNRGAGDKP